MQVNVAGLRRNIKNLAHNYSDAQVKVREATSNDPWGPSATIMAEIADLTYNVVAFSEIMQMIWKRLNDHGKNWRHVYKALILLEYLIKTGTDKVAQQCKENIFAIQTLREFVYFEEGKDQGTHVREKAKQLVTLLKDDERLKNERVKALKAKERFAQHPSGFGSDGYIDGPTQRDMPPGWQEEPKSVSELEMVRPQTAGEEELQLQLAMAMSREEAEQEEAKRRSDDVRLQLALSQSEQDFKDQTKPYVKKEEQPSHLLDLLDISLGATSISSPPLGATGGTGTDPWVTPARAASQLSDPWSGTSSPQIDPWQPTAAMRTATASAPLGAVGGMSSNGDAWGLRTQSPSVASGSSTEGWLHSNGGAAAMNGNSIPSSGAVGGVDPWLSKTAATSVSATPADPWLNDGARPGMAAVEAVNAVAVAAAPTSADPWAPKAAVSNDDPWKSLTETNIAKKPSPDMDEFDIITNRNKTGDLLTNHEISGPNNNNASLIDDIDLLLSTNSPLSRTGAYKKPLKTPQAFLGENSSLVNLDNLIKPVQTQSQTGSAAYNPFSDTVVPPKTNLFQQQQPAVPSINQLKQQQPFAMSMNQDPWAPVANTNNASQSTRNYLIDYDDDDMYVQNNNNSTLSSNSIGNSNSNTTLQYSKSEFDVFNTSFAANDFYSGGHQFQTQVQVHSHSVDNIRNMQMSIENETANAFDKIATTTTTSAFYQQQPQSTNSQYQQLFNTEHATSTLMNHNFQANNNNNNDSNNNNNNRYNNNNNNNSNNNSNAVSFANNKSLSSFSYMTHPAAGAAVATTAPTDAPFALSYSNALSAALAGTPGVKIAPVGVAAAGVSVGGADRAAMSSGGYGTVGYGFVGGEAANALANGAGSGGGSGGGSLFSYGFYDANSKTLNVNNNNNNNINSATTLGNCKLENNNNMPWMKSEAASSSNPFLS